MDDTQQEIQQLILELKESRIKGRFFLLSLLVQLIAFIGFMTELLNGRTEIAAIWTIMQMAGLLLMSNNRIPMSEYLEINKKLERLEELQNSDRT